MSSQNSLKLLSQYPKFTLNGKEFEPLKNKKPFAMFIYLIIKNEPVPNEELRDIFWPNENPESVTKARSEIRKIIGEIWSLGSSQSMTWCELKEDCDIEIDIKDFEKALEDEQLLNMLLSADTIFLKGFFPFKKGEEGKNFEDWRTRIENSLRERAFNELDGRLNALIKEQPQRAKEFWEKHESQLKQLEEEYELTGIREAISKVKTPNKVGESSSRLARLEPALPTPKLYGRDLLVREIIDRLRRRSCVGLWGPGGIGKTALVSKIFHELKYSEIFPDGVYWLALGPKPELSNKADRLCEMLGEKWPTTIIDLGERFKWLRSVLSDKKCLVIIDDVWEVGSVGQFIHVNRDADYSILFTTRTKDPGFIDFCEEEDLIKVPALKEEGHTFIGYLAELSNEDIRKYDAGLRSLALKVGYLPLALRILGSQLRSQIQDTSIDSGIELVDNNLRNLLNETVYLKDDDRYKQVQFTPPLHAVFRFSYLNLLNDSIRSAFRQVSVFSLYDPGTTFSHEALIDVWNQSNLGESTNFSIDLINSGLLEQDTNKELTKRRYHLHPLIAQYAKMLFEEKDSSEKQTKTVLAHAQHYAKVVEGIGNNYKKANNENARLKVLTTFDLERANIDVAHHRLLEQPLQTHVAQLVLRYAKAIANFGFRRYLPGERLKQFKAALEATRTIETPTDDIKLLKRYLAAAYYALGEYEPAINLYDEIGTDEDPLDFVRLLIIQGTREVDRGEYKLALTYYTRALMQAQGKDPYAECSAHSNMGDLFLWLAVDDKKLLIHAKAHYNDALRIADKIGSQEQLVRIHRSLGQTYVAEGNFLKAKTHYKQSLHFARKLRMLWEKAVTGWCLGELCTQLNRWDLAKRAMKPLLKLMRDQGHVELDKYEERFREVTEN